MRSMKIFLLIFWGTMSMSAQNVSPQFSELKGFVDYSGSTHLLYRIFSSQGNSFYNSSSNSIYDLDVTTKTDSIYLWDEYWCNQFMGSGINIYDYEFWNGDSKKYIICGDHVNCFEPHLFISRFDTSDVLEGMFLSLNKIDISKQNDSIVLVGPDMLKSIDGGISWDTLSLEFSFLSLSPFDDNVFLQMDLIKLIRMLYINPQTVEKPLILQIPENTGVLSFFMM